MSRVAAYYVVGSLILCGFGLGVLVSWACWTLSERRRDTAWRASFDRPPMDVLWESVPRWPDEEAS